MRIGVIGWYGHDNAGDERILHCLRGAFEGDELVPMSDLDDARRRADELDRCDYVLFGGGGMVVRGFGRYASIFRRLRVPFGCVGLGVEAAHRDNRALLDVLRDRAEFVYVRDRASLERLDRHFKVMVAPDLTFLDPYEVVEWNPDDVCALNLRHWAWKDLEFGGWAHRALSRAASQLPRVAPKLPLPRFRPEPVLEALRGRFGGVVPVPLYHEPVATSDRTALGEFFASGDDAFRPERLAGCRYLVGMRLHSLIFACQMGIPFVSLSYQPKNKAFCASCGLDELSVPLGDTQALARAIDRLLADAPAVRERLLETRERNVREARRVMAAIVRLVRSERKWN